MNIPGQRLAHFDLPARARWEMVHDGFEPEFSPEALRQANQSESPGATDGAKKDLRALLWSSIDNRESRDLDQIEAAERLPNGHIRLLIGIADVDERVPKGSPVDRHAARNCCSVYTGVAVFPLLPEALSTDRTSLLQDQDRDAVVVEMEIDACGEVTASTIYRARTRNYAQLAYEDVGEWLDGDAPISGARGPHRGHGGADSGSRMRPRRQLRPGASGTGRWSLKPWRPGRSWLTAASPTSKYSGRTRLA